MEVETPAFASKMHTTMFIKLFNKGLTKRYIKQTKPPIHTYGFDQSPMGWMAEIRRIHVYIGGKPYFSEGAPFGAKVAAP